MAFSIDLLEESASEIKSGQEASWGLIRIGSHEERFVAAMDYWDATDYRRHWQQALTRIVKTSSTSGLVTSIYDPATANFISWWPMYREGVTVYFQNHILFLKDLAIPFDPDDPFRFVPSRTIVNQDGEKISEWSAPIADLESYLSRGGALRRTKLT
jgi:hypothetical protein